MEGVAEVEVSGVDYGTPEKSRPYDCDCAGDCLPVSSELGL